MDVNFEDSLNKSRTFAHRIPGACTVVGDRIDQAPCGLELTESELRTGHLQGRIKRDGGLGAPSMINTRNTRKSVNVR